MSQKKVKMKKNILIVGLCCLGSCLYAQTHTPAQLLASKIANKMADSLSLNDGQKQGIFDLNISLYTQKQTVWSHYSNRDSLRVNLQKIEDTRDSLYHTILNDSQYQLYIQKKINIINNK